MGALRCRRVTGFTQETFGGARVPHESLGKQGSEFETTFNERCPEGAPANSTNCLQTLWNLIASFQGTLVIEKVPLLCPELRTPCALIDSHRKRASLALWPCATDQLTRANRD